MATPSKDKASESKRSNQASRLILFGVFEDREEAQRALEELEQAGFTKNDVGFVLRGSDVVSGDTVSDATETKDVHRAMAGAMTGGIAGGLLGAAMAIVIPGVGPVLAVGILASAIGFGGAGVAIGGILGAMAGDELSDEEAKFYEKHFNDGRALVIVRAPAREAQAAAIIHRHGGYDMHSCPAPHTGRKRGRS
jgi:hypothetical protein